MRVESGSPQVRGRSGETRGSMTDHELFGLGFETDGFDGLIVCESRGRIRRVRQLLAVELVALYSEQSEELKYVVGSG
ncbi:hypothetical protein PIB30_093285, partial [Stylosanthes scabra]|nr:hypothetical protein [Stylosanthes scabra]